ncbi:hypothetical protein [Phycicoccus sp. Root101]|uniref:hypothetical protein n=1 Tax=Phycicoccus sp. Root101 TaxID=1736421 RepID=UPI001F3ACECE|nr:hypothetical protein [Phycicoccus sp. Root101]
MIVMTADAASDALDDGDSAAFEEGVSEGIGMDDMDVEEVEGDEALSEFDEPQAARPRARTGTRAMSVILRVM